MCTLDTKHMQHLKEENETAKQAIARLLKNGSFTEKKMERNPLTFEAYLVWFCSKVLDEYYKFVPKQEGEEHDSASDSDEDDYEGGEVGEKGTGIKDDDWEFTDVTKQYSWKPAAVIPSGSNKPAAVIISGSNRSIADAVHQPEAGAAAMREEMGAEQTIPENRKKKEGHCCDTGIASECAVM